MSPPSHVCGRPNRRRRLSFLVAAGIAFVPATPASAQFDEPCQLTCIGVLGVTSFVAATGASVAAGRITGGMSSVHQGLVVWGGTFAAVAGGGMALSENGERQERAVYAAGIGMVTGALVGLALQAARTDGSEPYLFAGALIGATAGAVVGGVYGALSYEADESAGSVPLFSVTIPF